MQCHSTSTLLCVVIASTVYVVLDFTGVLAHLYTCRLIRNVRKLIPQPGCQQANKMISKSRAKHLVAQQQDPGPDLVATYALCLEEHCLS